MKKWMLTMALALLFTMTGCASGGAEPVNAASSGAAEERGETAAHADPASGGEEKTVYSLNGLALALPERYVPLLLVETDPSVLGEDVLIQVSEKRSAEEGAADYGEDAGFGLIFSISRGTQADHEQNLMLDIGGQRTIATGGGAYYFLNVPTDVRFYRSEEGGAVPEDPDWASWAELNDALVTAAVTDFISRNGLEPWDAAAFYAREYTYDGPHEIVRYDDRFDRYGTRDEYWQLILSQPVRQGAGGIWCVERFYDANGNRSFVFPMGSQAAMEVYTALQDRADAGETLEELTPLGAARAYVNDVWRGAEDPAGEESFSLLDGLNQTYMDQNRAALQLVLRLQLYDWNRGNEPTDEELLDCMAAMMPESWGVLGLALYGSEWWPPVQAALERAAVGEDQTRRDARMLACFLSYEGESDIIRDGLTAILRTQYLADETSYLQALETLSDAERARIPNRAECG